MSNFPAKTLMWCFLFIVSTSGPAMAQDSIIFIPEVMKYRPTMETTCTPKRICAINNTSTPIENPTFTLTGAREFVIQDGFQTCPNPLPPDGICEIFVDFCPEVFGEYQGLLQFTGTDRQVPVSGTGHARGI